MFEKGHSAWEATGERQPRRTLILFSIWLDLWKDNTAVTWMELPVQHPLRASRKTYWLSSAHRLRRFEPACLMVPGAHQAARREGDPTYGMGKVVTLQQAGADKLSGRWIHLLQSSCLHPGQVFPS